MNKKTIILLCAPRCGSSAIYKMFQKHPAVGTSGSLERLENFEPNFWNFAAEALHGNVLPFRCRFSKSHPFLEIPEKFTEETVFYLWDAILDKQGPVIFDKTPFYLGNREAIRLIYKYKSLGNDVRVFALIRDPKDAITSQHELFQTSKRNYPLQKREAIWLEQYDHLEDMQKTVEYIPLFRYEDFSAAPACYAPTLFNLCGLPDYPEAYAHIKTTSKGRKSASLNPDIWKWKMSDAFKQHLQKYGYLSERRRIFRIILGFLIMLPGNIYRMWSNLNNNMIKRGA